MGNSGGLQVKRGGDHYANIIWAVLSTKHILLLLGFQGGHGSGKQLANLDFTNKWFQCLSRPWTVPPSAAGPAPYLIPMNDARWLPKQVDSNAYKSTMTDFLISFLHLPTQRSLTYLCMQCALAWTDPLKNGFENGCRQELVLANNEKNRCKKLFSSH